jgi:hypothetical protein
MRCPRCFGELRAGRIRARRLGDALQSLELVLVDDSGAEHSLPPSRAALACASCDALLLGGAATPASDVLSCFECGATIEANADRCELCGWSWNRA